MKVSIKNFKITSLDLGNNGIEICVKDAQGKSQIGDLVIKKTGLVWCKGKTQPGNGISISWAKFMELMEETQNKRKPKLVKKATPKSPPFNKNATEFIVEKQLD